MSHAPYPPPMLSVEASPEQQARPARCALATGSPYTCRDYMDAMAQARRERDDLSSELMSEAIDAHDWLETLAKAVGIQTGRESWWDSNGEQQRAKVLERIKCLRANTDSATRR